MYIRTLQHLNHLSYGKLASPAKLMAVMILHTSQLVLYGIDNGKHYKEGKPVMCVCPPSLFTHTSVHICHNVYS